jgi:hypothetical protein
VKCLPSLVLIVCLLQVCTGCGNVFIRGAIQPGFSTITGSVSIVQLTGVTGSNGTTVQATFVTFLQAGMSSTIGFCGDQRSQFPLQQMVRADFDSGQPCANIIVVVIL